MTMTREIAQAMNLPADQKGVVVMEVMPNGPADKAGLQGSPSLQNGSQSDVLEGGDVITAIDGQKINTFEDLTSYLLSNTQVGQEVTLTIIRQGREQTIDLTLGTLPSTTSQ